MAPYLSFVFCGNNAGYGGDFRERMQVCLDNLYQLAQKYKLDADVTVVEWAPPADRLGLAEVLRWSATIPTRIITVSSVFQNRVPNPNDEKFFEYHAKNVGIRRATGQFILSTNPDNIYSPELIARLAKHDLDPNCFYRVNRTDINSRGEILVTHYKTAPELHFNASGDFILMHRDAWAAIRGHPEVPYSLTVDGHTVYLAAQEGLEQVILPEPMYHQDHSRTSKYFEPWDDLNPHGVKNEKDDWGLARVEFSTREI